MPFQDLGTRGYWNASTNVPIIKAGKGENGASYQVSVAGSTEIDGISDWRVGDVIFFLNDTWMRIPGQNTLDARGPYTGSLQYVLDGGGSAITTGFKGHLKVPFDCTIDSWEIIADQSGSIVVDIWKDVYANLPATDADSITAAAPPTLSAAAKAASSILTGWTTSVAAGDYLGFNVDSVSTVRNINIILNVTRL
jgi:hypothetical protein